MGEGDKEESKTTYQVDENLANGPLSKRGCNDILCCLLFLANIVAIIFIGAYGFSQGHPSRLLVPYDSDKRACGKDEGVADKPYIYLPVPKSLTRSVCLKECPTDSIDNQLSASSNTSAQSQWSKLSFAQTLSAFNPNPTTYNVASWLANSNAQDMNSVAVYQTKGFFGRVCLPYGPDAAKLVEQVGTAFGEETQSLEKYIADLKVAWATLLGSMGIAFVVAMVYMVLLRYFAGLITWLTILAYFACLIALAILLLTKGNTWIDEGTTSSDEDMKTNGRNLKYVSYGVFAFAGICAIIFLCLFRRIQQAIAIIKSAALFVAEVKSVFLVPPVITIFNMIFVAWWIVAFVYVYSIGDITGSNSGPFASVTWSKNVRYMLAYHIFGGLWVNAFFGALIQFILATACALWYFNKPNEPHRPVYTGLVRGMTNHFGSLAFGAFLLAVVQFVRLVLEYIEQQVKKTGQNQNTFVKYLLKCLKCYAECFERFIKFLNKNAYIQISITGKHFCAAAKDAFMLIWTNPLKFGIIATIGNVFIFIGRIFIAGFTGLICYIILTNVEYYKTNLFSPILPTAFCVIIGYFIGTFFMSVYGMGTDTILQCTCLDEELMKKTGKNPDRCPGPLKEFFQEHGK